MTIEELNEKLDLFNARLEALEGNLAQEEPETQEESELEDVEILETEDEIDEFLKEK